MVLESYFTGGGACAGADAAGRPHAARGHGKLAAASLQNEFGLPLGLVIVDTIVASAGYRAMIENAGSVPVSSTPAELQQVIAQTLDDTAATIREFGMQQEQ